MTSDARAQQAREAHAASLAAVAHAGEHRRRRDDLVRQLRREDPTLWTYPALAKAVGCSAELVAAIIQGRV